jgi:hypothetical protein
VTTKVMIPIYQTPQSMTHLLELEDTNFETIIETQNNFPILLLLQFFSSSPITDSVHKFHQE